MILECKSNSSEFTDDLMFLGQQEQLQSGSNWNAFTAVMWLDPSLVSEPDPQKNRKEGRGDWLGAEVYQENV